MAWRSLCIFGAILTSFSGLSLGQSDDNDDSVIRNTVVSDPITAYQFFRTRGWVASDGTASEIIDLATFITAFQVYAHIPVTGVLDDTTMAKMNSPKCGNPDFGSGGYKMTTTRRRRFTKLGTTWPQNHITWYLEGISNDLLETVIRSELMLAYQYWEDVSALTFEEVFTSDADILINFYRLEHGDGNAFDGKGNVLAHAFSPGRGRGGDMHFDDDELFTASTGVNLQQVAVHEIGHSVGLGHSTDINAIMAAFYSYRANLVLSDDDIRGIQSLYGPPTNNPATRPTVPVMQTEATMTTTPTPPRTLPAIFCNGEFDASVESFDDNVYFFQGDKVFKVLQDFKIDPNYPKDISAEFPGVPDYVDAAFLWEITPAQKYIYIFKGSWYWRFYNGAASGGYPRSISAWGIPANIDGAFRWTGNRIIYFFKDDLYYRYNTMAYRIDAGYPQPLKRWNFVQYPISAALDWNGKSYFFSGQYYQIFFDKQFKSSGSLPTAQTWLGCETEGLKSGSTVSAVIVDDDSGDSGGILASLPSFYVIIVTSFVSVWLHSSS